MGIKCTGMDQLLNKFQELEKKAQRGIADKALNKAGQASLENSIFRETFEQIGRKLTLKSSTKLAFGISALFGALIDTAQMKKVLEYADIFYQKRFIMEKSERIDKLVNNDDLIEID